MYRIPLLLICFLLFKNIGSAQTQTQSSKNQQQQQQQPVADINLRVYQQSIGIADYATAISAVHYLLASDPAKYASWADTLSLLYLQSGAYRQSYIISQELIGSKGYSDLRMEIKAISAKELQQTVEAIDAYSTLFSKTGKPAYGFEELQLEYAIRRLGESIATGNKLLQAGANDSSKITIAKLDGKTAQQVSFKAAVENIMGLAYLDLKDKDNAVASFNVALKENPDFEQAKNNLNVANSLASDKK